MDYGFTHEGKVYTPDGAAGITPEASADRNAAIEAAELRAWAEKPDRIVAYYRFPVGAETRVNRFGELRRQSFAVLC